MIRLIKLYKLYGIHGFFIYFKLKFNCVEKIKIPKIKHSITLRKKTSDTSIFGQIFIDNQYQLSLKFKPTVIIDAGANIGLASIYFANFYLDAKIIAIEPEKNNYNLLKFNTLKYKNITPLNLALWNDDTEINLINEGNGESGYVTKQLFNTSKNSFDTIKTITINSIIKEFKIEVIDILKIDIEGAEKELFEKNYENWLPITKVIIIELHDRLKKGTSTSLFNTILKYDFSFDIKGENIVLINNKLL